jgi:hypothetical protein
MKLLLLCRHIRIQGRLIGLPGLGACSKFAKEGVRRHYYARNLAKRSKRIHMLKLGNQLTKK